MERLAYTSILFALLTSAASVQAQAPQRQGAGPAARIMASIPASSMTVTHLYKQNVYVSVREHIESSESFVIQEWWPDSRRVTDVAGEKPGPGRPQRLRASRQSEPR